MLKIYKRSRNNLSHKLGLSLAILAFACAFNVSVLLAQGDVSPNQPKTVYASPEQLSASFAEVARRVEPAVVNIDTKGKVPDVTVKDTKPPEDSDDILDFFRRQLPRRPSYAVGSGFIVDKSGYILTNYHVVDDASRITVRLENGDEYIAKIVGMDEETDLAVLKIEAGKDLPFIALGDSTKVRVGDWVLAIGSPFGLAQTVTAGIISQTKRETPYATAFQKFIQTDAAINRGNSGGPLVNMNGEVIGVNSQIATSTGDYNGIGFALPSNEVANVYRQLLQNGKVRRGYLGVLLDSVKAEFAKVYGLPEAKGAIITDIRDKRSAAATAGLQAGDVILEFNGEKVASAQDLIEKVAANEPDRDVSISFIREVGNRIERKTATIRLAERPSNNRVIDNEKPKKLPLSTEKTSFEPFGLTLTELTPDLAKTYRVEGEKGVIVKNINPASFIADVKASNGADALNEGDLIQRINRTNVTDLKSFNEIAGTLKKGDAVVLHVLNYNRLSRSMQQRIVQFTVQ